MNLIIERAFIMAILMSISGFVFCAIFLPFERYARKLVSPKAMVKANTVALLSFVIPFYFAISIKDGTEVALINGELLVFQDAGGYDSFVCNVREHFHMEYLGFIWLIGVFVILLHYLWKYLRLLNVVKKQSFYICDDFWSVKFSEIKNEKKVSNVFLVGCCGISTPCTVGIRKKYIIIPSYMINAFENQEVEFILQHEFYHIVNDDPLRNSLILILSCLNWFNPLYHFLRKNLSEWTEIACDGEVTKDCSKEQRRQYCELIIKVLSLEDDKSEKEGFVVNFIGMKNYKRRIMEIMKQKKTSSMVGRVFVTSLVFTSLFCGTAAAKEADMSVHMLFSKNIDMVNSNEISIIESSPAQIEDDIVKSIYGEEMIPVDEEGVTCTIIYNEEVPNVQEVPENQVDPKHVHKYVDITIQEHKKNADGSCVTKYYEGQKCTSCGKVVKGDKIGEMSYKKCPH